MAALWCHCRKRIGRKGRRCEKLGIGGANATRSRTGRQGKSPLRTSWSTSRHVPAFPVRYDCKVWPASVQLHAQPSPAECETGHSESIVASYMSKIASECSFVCCCTRLVKKIRSGQASLGMERSAFLSGQGSRKSLHSSKENGCWRQKEAYSNTLCVFGTSIQPDDSPRRIPQFDAPGNASNQQQEL